jgi:flagellar FliL protein
MSDISLAIDDEPKKASKLPLILGALACIIGLSGGFFATYTGLILSEESSVDANNEHADLEILEDIAFVEVPPIIVNLRPGSANKHLSFRVQLEVPELYRKDVEHLLPRIIDVLNGYLSALETEDFANPTIIVRLRSQLLRRVQVVTGLDRVNDLLVMEFLLN